MSSTDRYADMQDEIRALARDRNAIILAHNYQRPEVQDVADVVGDSLGLSREAARTDADVIVFCGVHFMAETAAILAPQKTVLLPDLGAGCSLSATIDATQLRAWKAEHPGAVVVSYVNTTAEVKAESDYCCTSGNAVEVVQSVPAEREILFLPDMFLGALVVVGEDDGIPLAGEMSDLLVQLAIHGRITIRYACRARRCGRGGSRCGNDRRAIPCAIARLRR